jgi:hypothetical protein
LASRSGARCPIPVHLQFGTQPIRGVVARWPVPDPGSPFSHYQRQSRSLGLTTIWVLPLDDDRKASPYLQTKANERRGRLSPDGKSLPYSSDESSRVEVYVTTFPNPGGKWQASTDGGDVPVWGRDGKNLFFLGPDRKMMAVQVKGGERFEAGTPKPLFDTHIMSGPQVRFDIGPTAASSFPSIGPNCGHATDDRD